MEAINGIVELKDDEGMIFCMIDDVERQIIQLHSMGNEYCAVQSMQALQDLERLKAYIQPILKVEIS